MRHAVPTAFAALLLVGVGCSAAEVTVATSETSDGGATATTPDRIALTEPAVGEGEAGEAVPARAEGAEAATGRASESPPAVATSRHEPPTAAAESGSELESEEGAFAIHDWNRTDLVASVGSLANVADVLITEDQRVVAGYYHRDGTAGIAIRSVGGGPWSSEHIAGARQLRDIVELPDGALLATGTGDRDGAIVWRNDGDGWEPVGRDQLPNDQATNGWDLLVARDGAVLLATDSLRNDPERAHESIHRSTDGGRTWTPVAPLPGLGVLAMAQTPDGTLLAATEDSEEHDDPSLAGQARIYASTDGGATWGPPGEPDGANRVYVLAVLSDGTVWAGSGIEGEVFESSDGGRTWQPLPHVPSSSATVGEGALSEEITLEASRVYSILELADGRVLVGTGNKAGDLFITDDRGRTWEPLPETGPNNVVWGLAQSADGTVWVGTGSTTGDLLTASAG